MIVNIVARPRMYIYSTIRCVYARGVVLHLRLFNRDVVGKKGTL